LAVRAVHCPAPAVAAGCAAARRAVAAAAAAVLLGVVVALLAAVIARWAAAAALAELGRAAVGARGWARGLPRCDFKDNTGLTPPIFQSAVRATLPEVAPSSRRHVDVCGEGGNDCPPRDWG
jgi:hypothetical protein